MIKFQKRSGLLKCACNNCKNTKYCLTKLTCYNSTTPGPDGTVNYCYGCFSNRFQSIQCNLKNDELMISCCNNKNFCNLNATLPNRTSLPYLIEEIHGYYNLFNIIVIGIAVLFLCLFILATLIYKCRKRKIVHNSSTDSENSLLEFKRKVLSARTPSLGNNNIKSDNNISIISDITTGYGQSELIQRTIARDIHIDYERGAIGQGRYGIVYTAKWNDERVAVKVFFSMNDHSWLRETEIYQTSLLRHENVLGYIASDIKSDGLSSLNMLLITEYHPLGSLFDYLQQNIVDSKKQLFKFLYSTINGLNHLHQEIISTNYKPSIAHRDLKSKNILVKSNLECCLADFGLAVRYDSQKNQMDYCIDQAGNYRLNKREGSVRYMAPECLNQQLNINSIDELKKTDIYSYSFVIWELLRRFKDQKGITEEHKPPFYELIQGEPTIEIMTNIVCIKKIRPKLRQSLSTDKIIEELIEIMKECWKESPNERLSSLYLKKKLKKIFISDIDYLDKI